MKKVLSFQRRSCHFSSLSLLQPYQDASSYPPLKRKTFVEYLSANEEKLGIRYTTHLINSAGREVRGFKGIGSIICPSVYASGGWQKVDPDDNPFKDA